MQRISDDFLTPEEEQAIRRYDSGEDTTEKFDNPGEASSNLFKEIDCIADS